MKIDWTRDILVPNLRAALKQAEAEGDDARAAKLRESIKRSLEHAKVMDRMGGK